MIAWFTRNGVAANLIMFFLVVGGALSIPKLELEMFPEFSLDQILVRVPYPGASPSEVEEGIVERIEESLQGLEGIRRINATANEGIGVVRIEVETGYNLSRVKEDVKTRVDAIITFPENAERPTVEELLFPRDVLYIAIAGDTDERNLRLLAERVRDDLLTLPQLSQISLLGVREFEIGIEVSEATLRAYNLTFDEIVVAVQRSSLDIPGGAIKAERGEILLRTVEQNYEGDDFADIVLRVNPDGSRLRLGDIATIDDGFADDAIISEFGGQPAAFLRVQEVGNESPLEISAAVSTYIESSKSQFPPEVTIAKYADSSYYLKDRINLLVKNGLLGLALVILALTLFLRPMLAMFVAIGIPASFCGTLLLAPYIGLSINMISLFAFILVLGIVVDDAIVVGESIFSEFQQKGHSIEAAMVGAHKVTVPVIFAVLTTIVAFVPLFFLPGVMGKFLFSIPLVVIATLFWSLVQSKLVLPYHLTLLRKVGTGRQDEDMNFLQRGQRRIADALERFVDKRYAPFLNLCLKYRYVTMIAFVGSLVVTISLVAGGWVRYLPFPEVPSDYIFATVEYPEGTPVETVQEGVNRIYDGLDAFVSEQTAAGSPDPVGYRSSFTGDATGGEGRHTASVLLELTKSQSRTLSAVELADGWRDSIGQLPGVKSLVFIADTQVSNENPINLQLEGRDFDKVQAAAREIKLLIAQIPGVFDISDNFSSGKREIQLEVKPAGRLLGINSRELGSQVRSAFYGAEVQRVQRGRNEVKVMVRYPREERESVGNLENMRIRLEDGTEVPFSEVATVNMGQGFSSINRVDRERVLNITGNIDSENANTTQINQEVERIALDVLEKYPTVRESLEGQAAENAELMQTLLIGLTFVLIAIYGLLAVPLKSYFQPLIVMSAIPFALVGAIWGHFVTFQAISILSMMGILAAIGVVVNDSLVLVDYVNKHRAQGHKVHEAASQGAQRRFRPIFLTSLTTFVGLVPMLLERSLQAQFLIPMATSLAFGVMFATLITLFLVPSLYLILDDMGGVFRKLWQWLRRPV